MKYLEALKTLNKGKDWCVPKKGTPEYFDVIKIMNGNNKDLPASSATKSATKSTAKSSSSIKMINDKSMTPPNMSSIKPFTISKSSAKSNSSLSFNFSKSATPPPAPAPAPKRGRGNPVGRPRKQAGAPKEKYVKKKDRVMAKGQAVPLPSSSSEDKSATPPPPPKVKSATPPKAKSATPPKKHRGNPVGRPRKQAGAPKEKYVKKKDRVMAKGQAVPLPSSSSEDMSAGAWIKSSSIKPTSAKMKYNKANVIQAFLKDKLQTNKYTLENRIGRYKIIYPKLNSIKETDCLTQIKSGQFKGGFDMGGILTLEKKIGSSSVTGTIYATSMKSNTGVYPIASKLMTMDYGTRTNRSVSNEKETKLMRWITDNVILKGLNKHFVIMYKHSKCDIQNANLNDNERLVDYNEMCNGDLSKLVNDSNVNTNTPLMMNLLIQSFIAIASFHYYTGDFHNDAHYGNFLYQNNSEVGWYHYRYITLSGNSTDFYVKASKYNILIYDFGRCKKLTNINAMFDYMRIPHAFFYGRSSNGTNGWIDDPAPTQLRTIVNVNVLEPIKYAKNITMRAQTNLEAFTLILDMLLSSFKDEITKKRPADIINETPYLIGKISPYPII